VTDSKNSGDGKIGLKNAKKLVLTNGCTLILIKILVNIKKIAL
jgi:hypothetical protein